MKQTFISPTNADYYETLREDAAEGETNWSVSKHTRRGDRILLYVCAPVSAVVAEGFASEDAYLDDDPGSEWFGKYFVEMHGLRMLERPVTRAELMARFPQWGYWKQPRACVRVPDAYRQDLERLVSDGASAPCDGLPVAQTQPPL